MNAPIKPGYVRPLDLKHGCVDMTHGGGGRAMKQLIEQLFAAAFDNAQVAQIDPKGERFDPHHHQAMTMVDSDQPANSVVHVMQTGYLLQDRVLRPALVSVAKPKPDA